MKNLLKIAVLGIALPTSSMSAPDATTQALLENAPSMLDWGILRLEASLDRERRFGRILSGAYVDYDYATDRITISGSAGAPNVRLGSEAIADAKCKKFFSDVRLSALVGDNGMAFLGNSYFSNFFILENNQPDHVSSLEIFLTDLDQKFRIEFTGLFDDDGEMRDLVCSGPLLGVGYAKQIKERKF